MEADNPAWVPPEPGAVRALPVPLKLMDQARAWKHDKDLRNRLTDQAAGLLGHDAVLAIIGRQNAGKLPSCGTPAWEQFIDLAEAGDVDRWRSRSSITRSAVRISRIPQSSATADGV